MTPTPAATPGPAPAPGGGPNPSPGGGPNPTSGIASSSARPRRSWRRVLFKWLFGLLLLAVVLVAVYLFFVLKWSYSSGERAGWVQKLSHKGWFCKTWEGELAMVSMPGATPEKFFFTVWDDAVAEEINRHMGKRVSLHYEEKIGIPTSCFGETRHFVTRVTVVDQNPLAPGVVVPTPPATGAGAPAAPGGGQPATPQPGTVQPGAIPPGTATPGTTAPGIPPQSAPAPTAPADPAPSAPSGTVAPAPPAPTPVPTPAPTGQPSAPAPAPQAVPAAPSSSGAAPAAPAAKP